MTAKRCNVTSISITHTSVEEQVRGRKHGGHMLTYTVTLTFTPTGILQFKMNPTYKSVDRTTEKTHSSTWRNSVRQHC